MSAGLPAGSPPPPALPLIPSPLAPQPSAPASLAPRLVTDAEYGALRAELNFWQNVRLTVVGFDFAFVGGVLASEGLTKNPWVAVVLVTAVLIGSVLFVWFATRSSLCIGAYLKVFYEDASAQRGWESRMKEWRFTPFTLFRHILSGVFLLQLGLVYMPVFRTLLATRPPADPSEQVGRVNDRPPMIWLTPPPPADPPAPPTPWFDPLWGSVAVGLTALFVGVLIAFLVISGGFRKQFERRWEEIRTKEAGGGS